MAVAVVGAFFTGEENPTGGVNGLVEVLSGRSGSFLGNIQFLAPLGFAFVAGMVTAVNPCGFAMLPAYLGLYLGSGEAEGPPAHLVHRLGRALLVGGVVTLGFVLLFGIVGIAISAGARSVIGLIPWLGLGIGVLLALVGAWLMAGGQLYTALAGSAAAHIGNPGVVGVRGYFFFGLSYATASLGCALPIFLLVVVTSQAVSGVLVALGQFLLYALGMGLVIVALTVSMALFKGTMVRAFRKTLPYVQVVTAGMMIVAGSYIVYYWLTIGDLG